MSDTRPTPNPMQIAKDLIECFDWTKTPEGFDYWCAVHDKLIRRAYGLTELSFKDFEDGDSVRVVFDNTEQAVNTLCSRVQKSVVDQLGSQSFIVPDAVSEKDINIVENYEVENAPAVEHSVKLDSTIAIGSLHCPSCHLDLSAFLPHDFLDEADEWVVPDHDCYIRGSTPTPFRLKCDGAGRYPEYRVQG